jgi:tetratricopeptide (TPR) repeat protein
MWGADRVVVTDKSKRALRMAAIVVLCCGMISPAWSKSNRRSLAAYKEGLEHFKRKSYGPAIDAFDRAYRYDRNPTLLFNIGRAFEELGEYNAATLYFQKCLRKTKKGPRKPIEEAIERARTLQSARVRGDDRSSPVNASASEVASEVAKAAPERPPQMAAEQPPPPPPVDEDAPSPVVDEDAPRSLSLEARPAGVDYTRETWVWATLGVGISMLSVAVLTGLEANDRSDALDEIEANPALHTIREFDQLQNEGSTWATTTDLLLGGGALAVSLASYFLFEREVSGFFAPSVSGTTVGVGFTF